MNIYAGMWYTYTYEVLFSFSVFEKMKTESLKERKKEKKREKRECEIEKMHNHTA